MPPQSTLSEFGTPDLSTPEGRITDLVENPQNPESASIPFGEDFWSCHSPMGLDDALSLSDVDLIRDYIELCRDELPGDYFGDAPMARQMAEDKYRAIDKLEAHIKHVEFPEPSEWPVEQSFVNWVRGLDVPESGDFTFDRQGWERVWDVCTVEELEFIRDACRHHYGRSCHSTSNIADLICGFLYYRGVVDLDEIIEVSGRGNGPSERRILHNIDVTLTNLDPVIGAHVLNWMSSTITRNISESGGGHYYTLDSRINISSDGSIEKAIENNWTKNTVAHELAHALHDMYGFFVDGGDSVDNRGVDPEEWEWDAKDRPHEARSTSQESFAGCIRQEWGKLRDGTLDALRDYQKKNADEFICVAFECWVVNPEKLEEEQPRMKEMFDAHFGPQNYEHMQLRLEPMPSPTEGADIEG